MKKRFAWQRLLVALATGAVVFQTSSCVEVSTGVTAAATTVTAGGVLYIVFRILND